MADKPEVIREQMDDTRKDLADKLDQLEQKLSGTVETVSSTVEAVTETVETVKDSVQDTVESVTEGVGNTVETVKEGVRSFFDVRSHVENHPWLMMGGSVVMGFLGGRLLLPRAAREETPNFIPTYTPTATPTQPPPPSSYVPPEERTREAEEGEGWLSKLGAQFGDQLGRLKGLALGTTLGVLRDMVAQWAPDSLRKDVTETINGFTSSLGGQVIREPVLGERNDRARHQEPDVPERGGVSARRGRNEEEAELAEATTTRTGRR